MNCSHNLNGTSATVPKDHGAVMAACELAGGGAPPFLRSAHLECPSSVILITVPALTGEGAIAADRQKRGTVGKG
jgi:hypothetical protein